MRTCAWADACVGGRARGRVHALVGTCKLVCAVEYIRKQCVRECARAPAYFLILTISDEHQQKDSALEIHD